MKRFMFSMSSAAALGLVAALIWSLPVVAQDSKKKKSPSDRTVRVVMGWAFAALPEKIKTKDGKEIPLDRSDSTKFMIPIDDSRRVIRVAMRSLSAARCGLTKLEVQNFRKMMAKEKALGKWTANQIRYIHRLYIAVGLVMTGDFTAGKEAEGNKDKPEGKKEAPKKASCPPEKTARVTAAIQAYLQEPDKAK